MAKNPMGQRPESALAVVSVAATMCFAPTLALASEAKGAPATVEPDRSERVWIVPFTTLDEDVPEGVAASVKKILSREIRAKGFRVVEASETRKPYVAQPQDDEDALASTRDSPALKRVRRLIAKGQDAVEQAEFGAAAQAFLDALAAIEEDARAISDLSMVADLHLERGVALFRARKVKDAEEALRAAVHYQPERTLDLERYPPLFVQFFDQARREVLGRDRGTLEVECRASDRVWLDGRLMGQGPMRLKDVLPGPHWVRVGAESGEAEQKAQRVEAAESVVLAFSGAGTDDAGEFAVGDNGRGVDRNRLDMRDVDALARQAAKLGAERVVVGAIFREPAAYQVRAIQVVREPLAVGRLTDISFDLDLLSAEIEVYKLAESFATETQGLSRPVDYAKGRFGIAQDVPRRIAVARPRATIPDVIAAPPRLRPEIPKVPEMLAVGPLGSGSPAHASAPPEARPQTLRNLATDLSMSEDDKAGGSEADETKWWLWAIVGVAAAGAAVGGGYLLLAHGGEDEGNLRVSWP